MGNLLNGLKKFIANKNTVTILAVLAGIIVLWWFYSYRVNQAVTTVSIPISLTGVDATKKIETDKDHIDYKKVNRDVVKDSDIITSLDQLKDKYICERTSVPANGFFYESQLCSLEQLPSSIWDEVPEGELVYTLSVDSTETYANSIMPGDHIDLYMTAVNEDGKIIYGKLIENIEVLRVRDNKDRDIPWDSTAGTATSLLFAVTEDFHTVLRNTNLVKGYQIDVFPVARGGSYSQSTGSAEFSSDYLQEFIMKNVDVHGVVPGED